MAAERPRARRGCTAHARWQASAAVGLQRRLAGASSAVMDAARGAVAAVERTACTRYALRMGVHYLVGRRAAGAAPREVSDVPAPERLHST